jgi:hypothetical protein
LEGTESPRAVDASDHEQTKTSSSATNGKKTKRKSTDELENDSETPPKKGKSEKNSKKASPKAPIASEGMRNLMAQFLQKK